MHMLALPALETAFLLSTLPFGRSREVLCRCSWRAWAFLYPVSWAFFCLWFLVLDSCLVGVDIIRSMERRGRRGEEGEEGKWGRERERQRKKSLALDSRETFGETGRERVRVRVRVRERERGKESGGGSVQQRKEVVRNQKHSTYIAPSFIFIIVIIV
jgi:hypothetical protein